MAAGDDELRIQRGRIQRGNRGGKRPKTFVGEVIRTAKRAGHTGKTFNCMGTRYGHSPFARRVALSCRRDHRCAGLPS